MDEAGPCMEELRTTCKFYTSNQDNHFLGSWFDFITVKAPKAHSFFFALYHLHSK